MLYNLLSFREISDVFKVSSKFIVVGFSLGDELGFPDSLGNTESSKKRSLDVRQGNNAIGVLPAARMPVCSSTFHLAHHHLVPLISK